MLERRSQKGEGSQRGGGGLDSVEERVRDFERACVLAKQKATGLETKLGGIELKLVGAESVISARDKEVADLKVSMEESENKFYNMGFADAENSSESIMFQSRGYGFGEGWMAIMSALSVPKESPSEISNRYHIQNLHLPPYRILHAPRKKIVRA